MTESNRWAVLEAARRQFEQRGYHGASLDVIADDAGFSKGAVYSRFDSKDDLFLAVLAHHIEQRHEATATQFAGLTGPADLPILVETAIGTNVATVAWQAALLEFRAHAWRHPDVNARYAEMHHRTIDSIAGFIAELYRLDGAELPWPAHLMATVALAYGTGTVAEFMADPDLDVISVVKLMTLGQQSHEATPSRSTP